MNRQINWRWLGRLGAGLLMLSGVLASAHTPVLLPKEEWVARYNGPGNGYDGANALVVDGAGNVYVTGGSDGVGTYGDYATLKYDRNGKLLWERRYNGPGNGYDGANALVVDGAGNVYVTGQGDDGGISYDYATLKYDRNGNLVWEKRYNGPDNSGDGANALAVDSAGNVYVTGTSYGADTGYGYATLKYDRNGNLLWESRYNGPGNGYDVAKALAVDGAGNVYVTGQGDDGGTGWDYATLKYDGNGNLLWERRYNGPGNGYDSASALAVDGAGNVYVTGSSYGVGPEPHASNYATLKYDRDGKLLWEKRYNGPGNDYDGANALAVDGAGNVYVTGSSDGDYATLKYDRDGTLLWERRYNGPDNSGDGARALAVDGAGNVYVTGWSYGADTSYGYATLKYARDGKLLWEKRYNGPGNGDDGVTALAVDGAGNVYVTGTSYDGTGNYDDFATIKYSQKPHYKLTLAIRGSGTGTVSSMPEGLNSDHDTTSAYFEKGSRVALTAVPTEDSTFAGWGRDCSGTGRCTVKMNDNQFVTATFTPPRYLLTVSKQGNGLGRVVSSPGGIDCGQGCAADSADYLKGTPVRLIADPKANSRFTGWSGACTGTAACVVTVNQALNVSATFTLR